MKNPIHCARLTDDQLMAELDVGETEPAITILRRRYESAVKKLVYKIVRDRHTAEDVVQDVFLKVFLKSHQYQIGTNFRAWLFGIARNQALNTLRNERHCAKPIATFDAGDDQDFDLAKILADDTDSREVEEREFMAAFEAAVDQLPPRNREVFRACALEGRAYADVAKEFGLPIGTVAIRIMRARQRLFRELSVHLDRIRRPPACVQ